MLNLLNLSKRVSVSYHYPSGTFLHPLLNRQNYVKVRIICFFFFYQNRSPVIGYLSKVGNTIFINRNLRFLKTNKSIIFDYISRGDNIILFPEGTTSDGIRVIRFKSSLLTSLEQKNILIQPIVVKYKSINGMPLNRWLKPIIAWYGDMDLKPHLVNILKLFSIKAKIIFLPTLNGRDFTNRKDMTSTLHHVIDRYYSDELNKSLLN